MYTESDLKIFADFFSPEEVEDFLQRYNASDPSIYIDADIIEYGQQIGGKGTLDTASRKTKVLPVKTNVNDPFLNKLLHLMVRSNQRHFKFDIQNYLPSFQLLRYNDDGSHFVVHRDIEKLGERKISVVVFLSDEDTFEGGLFLAFPQGPRTNRTRVKQTRGTVVMFPSDLHHGITPVTKGTRYSLVTWLA